MKKSFYIWIFGFVFLFGSIVFLIPRDKVVISSITVDKDCRVLFLIKNNYDYQVQADVGIFLASKASIGIKGLADIGERRLPVVLNALEEKWIEEHVSCGVVQDRIYSDVYAYHVRRFD